MLSSLGAWLHIRCCVRAYSRLRRHRLVGDRLVLRCEVLRDLLSAHDSFIWSTPCSADALTASTASPGDSIKYLLLGMRAPWLSAFSLPLAR